MGQEGGLREWEEEGGQGRRRAAQGRKMVAYLLPRRYFRGGPKWCHSHSMRQVHLPGVNPLPPRPAPPPTIPPPSKTIPPSATFGLSGAESITSLLAA